MHSVNTVINVHDNLKIVDEMGNTVQLKEIYVDVFPCRNYSSQF